MNRTASLAAIAVVLGSSPSFGQFGGMGGMGGGGGQGMVPGTMMLQGDRFAGAGLTEALRFAEIEMEGGQHLSGTIRLRPVIVDGDLGVYVIAPHKIKAIRFLKPVPEVEGNNAQADGDGQEGLPARRPLQNRAAMAGVARRVGRDGMASPTRGKVITTADKEIIGTIHIPADFGIELDFGVLTLAPAKLRLITLTDDHRQDEPAETGRPAAQDEHSSLPRYFRQGSTIIVISPIGDRATLYNIETKKLDQLELSGSKDAHLEVGPTIAGNLVALSLKGPNVTRIAVGDTATGTWHSKDLPKPFAGWAIPLVAPGVVVYNLGRDVYAYGADSQRWDVVELDAKVQATPSVEAGSALIENNGHIYMFSGKIGRWTHLDIRSVIDRVTTGPR